MFRRLALLPVLALAPLVTAVSGVAYADEPAPAPPAAGSTADAHVADAAEKAAPPSDDGGAEDDDSPVTVARRGRRARGEESGIEAGNGDPSPRGGARPVERKVVEPWSDDDGVQPKPRLKFGDYGFRGGLEQRTNAVWIHPLDVVSETDRKYSAIDQRLRLDGSLDWKEKVKVTTSVDILDGVLWGDNGTPGNGGPEPWAGASVNTKNVNVGRVCMVQSNPAAPADPHSYKLGLCSADPIYVRRLYVDVLTPFGLLRIGRQAFTEGAGVPVNDGDGRKNRFGYAGRGNNVDRILFATKPLEGFKPKERRNLSENEGLFLILALDKLVQDQPQKWGDDLQEFTSGFRFLAPKLGDFRDVEGRLTHTYRWDKTYGTSVNAFGFRTMGKIGHFSAGIDGSAILGSTREVSEAFRLITNDPPVAQKIRQVGGRAVIRYDVPGENAKDPPKFTAYLEADYASGDGDPTVSTPLTQFVWSDDSNVGLLMFKQTLNYQTQRAAAAANALLKSLNAPTFPVDAVWTRGSFTNAVAAFPQVDFRPRKDLLFRGGALVAWSSANVNDPVQSQQRRDGKTIQDDLVNFAGGKAGKFYGVELDGRVQFRAYEHVAFDLEGAVLFPGDAFQNADGYAARSFLVQGRSTVFF